MTDVKLGRITSTVNLVPFGEPLPYVALEHVEPGLGRLLPDIEVEVRVPTDVGMIEVRPDDVLFGRLRPYLAKSLLIRERTLASSEFVVIRPSPAVDAQWLSYVVLTTSFLGWAVATSEGVKMPRTSWEKLRQFVVQLPELAEQRTAADFLDAETSRIDALIKKRTAIIRLTRERMRASVSKLAGALSVVDDTEAARLEALGWRRMQLRRCFAAVDYGIGTASTASGAFPVLGMGNVDDEGQVVGEPGGYVDDVEAGLLLEPGDLLFNRTNSLAAVGKVGRFEAAGGSVTFASYLVRLRVNELADSRFLNYLLNSTEMLGLARSHALPSVGQANLNPSRYGSLTVVLPPMAAQVAIADALDAERAEACSLRALASGQVALLQEHRQAIITAAVTGQLDLTRGA